MIRPFRRFRNGVIGFTALAMLAGACGSGTDDAPAAASGEGGEQTADEQPAEAEPVTIGWSVAYFDHPVYQLMMEGAQEAAEECGAEVQFSDGQNDAATQASHVDTFLAQGVDAIALTPAVSDPLIPSVQKINDADVPFAVVDRRMFTQDTGIEWDVLISWDMVKSGTVGGEQAVEALTQEDGSVGGNLVVVEGTAGAGSTIDRGTAFNEVIEEHPDINVIYRVDGDFRRDKGLEVTENILQRFSPDEIDVIYYMNDEMALGGLTAIENAGLLDEFTIISVDGMKEALDALREGKIDYDGIFFPQDQGYTGVQILCDLARGEEPDLENQCYEDRCAELVEFEGMPWVKPGFFGVDQTNAHEPQFEGW